MTTLLLRILFAAQVALTVWLALPGDETRGVTTPIPPETPPTSALTIESAAPLAEPVARQWNPSATLIGAVMRVEWPREGAGPTTAVPDDGLIILTYAAGDEALSLLIDRVSGIIFGSETTEWSEGVSQPLPLTAVQRSSTVAVLAADVSAGNLYRSACPEFRNRTTVHLLTPTASMPNPAWLVAYEDERHRDQSDLVLRVDAVTGDIADVRRGDLTCDPEEE
jgi:hypothetical protein